MKVVHLSTNDIGGAAQAAKRLHSGLLCAGVESTYVSKYSHHGPIQNHISYLGYHTWKHYLDFGLEEYILTNLFPPRTGYSKETVLFTSPHSLYHPESLDVILKSDVVHLHWTSHFLDYQTFFKKINKPVVWTLHDMNPFTGGCHYSGECNKFEHDCIECPQIKNTSRPQSAKTYFDYKLSALSEFKNLTMVAPSAWLLQHSKKSLLFRPYSHHQIRYGCDSSVFNILDKQRCREKWRIPPGKIVLLFVAHSLKMNLKGFDLFVDALQFLNKSNFHLIIAGKHIPDLKFKEVSHTIAGYAFDENKMSELYNAADLYITPSIRDNQPNTIIESLLCGTPVLGFKIGGVQEMIIEGENGLFAKEMNARSIADGIHSFLTLRDRFDTVLIRHNAKDKYELSNATNQYLDLYRSLLH